MQHGVPPEKATNMLASRRVFLVCLRTKLYPDRSAALVDLEALLRKATLGARPTFRVYRCGFCGGLHIGRRKRRREPA